LLGGVGRTAHLGTATMKTILMLSGWAGSGKDAAATLLEEEMGYQRVAFADPLKACVAETTGLPADMFYTAAKDWPLPPDAVCPLYPTARTPREILLQHAVRERAVDPDIYARTTIQQILTAPGDNWVISDWRYRREWEFVVRSVRAGSARVIRARVLRPGIVPSADLTEHDLDDEPMDMVIHNAGTISDLRDALRGGLKTERF
jgi:hypothetical protein